MHSAWLTMLENRASFITFVVWLITETFRRWSFIIDPENHKFCRRRRRRIYKCQNVVVIGETTNVINKDCWTLITSWGLIIDTVLFVFLGVTTHCGCIFTARWRALASSFSRFLDHTQRRATVGRTPLDEWSIRRRDLYLTTHNTHNRQTSMPRWDSNPQSQQASGRRSTP
jgi:hypothetical protein